MLVKSFVLRRDSFKAIVGQCVPGTIAVVHPERELESLFRAVIQTMVVLKRPADAEIMAVKDYLDGVSDGALYQQKKEDFIEYVQDYLHQAICYSVPVPAVEDYILSQCANLCAQAVAFSAGVDVLDGRELVVCHHQGSIPVFDWAATCAEIERRCVGRSQIIISGGYARTAQGAVVAVGRGGANLMAALVASAMKADVIEFYVEGRGICGIAGMTYDEAAHYCAGKSAPFPSAALWPARRADIPIVVKGILNPDFPGTRISSQVEGPAVSGVVVDSDLDLVTIYGTGLLGRVGTSSTIFSALAEAGVNIRFISQSSSEYAISFAVRVEDSSKVREVISAIFESNPLIPVDDVMVVNREVCILTIFGSRMRHIPGVSGRVFSLLGDAGVSVIAAAQGGEELSISVVLDVKDLERAQKALEMM